jgi:hypothetical protein
MNSLLYIGAGLDTNPLLFFSDYSRFIFFDTQPRTVNNNETQFDIDSYKGDFINNLVSKYKELGFTLEKNRIIDKDYHKQILNEEQMEQYNTTPINNINPELIIFVKAKTKQIIKYYISTNISSNLNETILNDIKNTTGLIISKHFPDAILLNYIKSPITFYGYMNNDYIICGETNNGTDPKTIMNVLQEEPEQKYFDNFYLINEETREFIKKEDYFSLLYN